MKCYKIRRKMTCVAKGTNRDIPIGPYSNRCDTAVTYTETQPRLRRKLEGSN